MEMFAIARALALLATLGITDVPSVQVVDLAPTKSTKLGTVAYVLYDEVLGGEPTIYVVNSSMAFRDALRGDARPLAAVLAHERYHVLHGRYQGPAYDEELRVLRALKVKGDPVLRVRRAWELFKHDRPK